MVVIPPVALPENPVTTTQAAAAPRPMFDDPMSPLQILFSLRGRIPRKTWWLYSVLGLLLLSAMTTMLLGIAGFGSRTSNTVANLLLVWPGIALGVKRWHDVDRSGWWVLINVVPVVGFLVTLVANGVVRGTYGPNRYGDDLTGRI